MLSFASLSADKVYFILLHEERGEALPGISTVQTIKKRLKRKSRPVSRPR